MWETKQRRDILQSHYKISDTWDVINTCTHAKLKPRLISKWYYAVYIDISWSRKTHYIHRLVMLAFVWPSDLEVNHKDGCKTNNDINNLEYVSRQENVDHAIRTNLYIPWQIKNHESVSKKINQYTKRREYIKTRPSAYEVERKLGINHSSITKCCKWWRKYKSAWWYARQYCPKICIN